MNGRPLSAALLLLFAALLASGVHAQDPMERRASLFDLGIYGGGAWATDWFTTEEAGGDEGWSPGFAPIFGVQATYWTSPSFGIRLHGAYMPSDLPEAEGFDDFDESMTSWLYDLDLVFRPFIDAGGGWTASTTVFAGAGGITASADGEFGGLECVPYPPFGAGVCVPTGSHTSVQGVLGASFDATTLGRVTLFGEAALHGFPAPVEVTEAGGAERKFVLLPRLVLGVRAGFGGR